MSPCTKKQLCVLSLPLFLIFSPLLIMHRSNLSPAYFVWLALDIVFLAVFVISLIGAVKSKSTQKPKLSPIIPIMLIFSVAVIIFCNTSPRYDEGLYFYKAILSAESFDFSFESILSLAWHKHPMIPYALYITAGQTISNGCYLTVVLQNLLLCLISIYCMYRLLLFYCNRKNKSSEIFCAVASGTFAFSSVFITNCFCLGSDFPIPVFMPILLCCIVYKKKLLAMVAACCFMFSKMPATVLGIIILSILIIYGIFFSVKSGEKFSSSLKSRLFLIFPIILVILYLLLFSQTWGGSFITSAGESDVPNCFTVDLHYIALRLSQFFLFGYNWLLSAIIIICLAILLHRKKPSELLRHTTPEIAAIVISLFAYLFYCLFYVTHAHLRYQNLSSFYLAFFAGILLYRTSEKSTVAMLTSAFVSFLMLSAFFANSDPITNRLFAKYDFGGVSIIDTHRFSWENGIYDITDSVVYNCGYTSLSSLYEKTAAELKITTEDNVIFFDFSRWKLDFLDSWCDGAYKYDNVLHKKSVTVLNDEGYPMPTCFYVARRAMTSSNHEDFKNQFYIDSVTADYSLLPDNAVLILFPWQKDAVEKMSFYQVTEEVTVTYGGLSLYCYRLKK